MTALQRHLSRLELPSNTTTITTPTHGPTIPPGPTDTTGAMVESSCRVSQFLAPAFLQGPLGDAPIIRRHWRHNRNHLQQGIPWTSSSLSHCLFEETRRIWLSLQNLLHDPLGYCLLCCVKAPAIINCSNINYSCYFVLAQHRPIS